MGGDAVATAVVSVTEAEQRVLQAAAHKAECDAEVAAIEPFGACELAASALDTLNVQDIGSLKAMKSPPKGIGVVTAACICLLQTKQMKYEEIDTSWAAAQSMMSPPPKFLEMMLDIKTRIDEGTLPTSNFANIQWLLQDDDFDVEKQRAISSAAAGLANFILHINMYNDFVEKMKPKRRAAVAAADDLEVAMATKKTALAAAATEKRDVYGSNYDLRIVAACEGAAKHAALMRTWIDIDAVAEGRDMKRAPLTMQRVLEATALALGDCVDIEEALRNDDRPAAWDAIRASLLAKSNLRVRLDAFSAERMPEATVRRIEREYGPDTLTAEMASKCWSMAADLVVWLHASLAHYAVIKQRNALLRLKTRGAQSPTGPPPLPASLAAHVMDALTRLCKRDQGASSQSITATQSGAATQSSSSGGGGGGSSSCVEAWERVLSWVGSPYLVDDLLALDVYGLGDDAWAAVQAVHAHPDASNAAAVAVMTASSLPTETFCALVEWLVGAARRRSFASAPSPVEVEAAPLVLRYETLAAEVEAGMTDAMRDFATAIEALKAGWTGNIAELKAMPRPGEAIQLVFGAVAFLLGVPADIATTANGVAHTWSELQKIVGSIRLSTITTFDKDGITLDVLARLEPILQHPDFTPERMATNHPGLRLFAAWVRGLYTYGKAFHRLTAKRAQLASLQAQVEAMVFEEDQRPEAAPLPPMDFTGARLELRPWGVLAADEATPEQERVYRVRRRLYGSAASGGFASVPDETRRKNAQARRAWSWLMDDAYKPRLPPAQRVMPWLRPAEPTPFGAADRRRDRETAAAIHEACAAKAVANGWVVFPTNRSWGAPGWRGGSARLGEVAGEWLLEPAAWEARVAAKAAEREHAAKEAEAAHKAAEAEAAAKTASAAAKMRENAMAAKASSMWSRALDERLCELGGGEGITDGVVTDSEDEAPAPLDGGGLAGSSTKGLEAASGGEWTAEGWLESLGVMRQQGSKQQPCCFPTLCPLHSSALAYILICL